MRKSLALITVHGMGDYQSGYADAFRSRIRQSLGETAWASVIFKSVYYQDILQQRQDRVFSRMEPLVDWRPLRKFLLYGFSDAASLEVRKYEPGSPYARTQERIRQALDEAFDEAGGVAVPVVMLAHSLGCQVVSNYLWDADPTRGTPSGIWALPSDDASRDAFRRLRTLRHLCTTGCNIPIFVAGHDPIVPVTRPNPDFTWHNLYDKDDVLGWPLGPLSEAYADLVRDIPIRAGGGFLSRLTAWSPLSHGGYWTNRSVLEDVARAVRG